MINWKVRLRNPVFWTTMLPALIAFIYTLLGAIGVTPGVSQNDVANWVATAITALTTIGVLVDPTTKGASDSAQALTYTEPKDDTEGTDGN